MTQTLRYLDELIAASPDNTSGLILPVHRRDQIVSKAPGRGYVIDETEFTMPVTSGVFVAVNPLLPTPDVTVSLWAVDGNNFLLPNYSSLPATTVPAGYSKLATFEGSLSLTKSGGGTDNYTLTVTQNGSPVGLPEEVSFVGAGTQNVHIRHVVVTDISVETDTHGLSIRGDGTGTDLQVEYFTFTVEDAILLSAP